MPPPAPPGVQGWIALLLKLLLLLVQVSGLPYEYTVINENCPGAEWNIMCRGCCEYDQIRCKCPNQGDVIGYAVPCCRNEANECDPCIIHPGCSIFENCKRCNNGTWGVQDDFFIKGKYCSECRTGWSGGDCMKCGGVINAKRGYIAIESYPTNAHCEWTLNVNPQFTIELRFSMLSLEFDYSCRYDYVEVRDGDNVDAQVIGRFCGNERPPPIRSTGHSLHVLFVSDGYKSFDGFHLSFAESSVVMCRSPAVPPHGMITGDDFRFGAQVTFHCEAGFHLEGNRKATCQLDGTWSSEMPLCVPDKKMCLDPGPFLNGYHLLVLGADDTPIIVQFFCNSSYKLNGEFELMCQPDGTWSGQIPQCVKLPEKKHCKEPEAPVNGYYILSRGPGDTIIAAQFFCNNTFALSGNPQRTCQQDGTWSGKTPVCVKGCREPKVSDMVRQKVLPPHVTSRTTPVHKFYSFYSSSSSSTSIKLQNEVSPTKGPPVVEELPPGFHPLYTQLEYECASPFYHQTGSTRRKCLKTGRWSGRHATCLPVCGKFPNLNLQKLSDARWPWQAAVYRRSTKILKNESFKDDWQLICTGALINQRSVLVAAHCVTELGKLNVIKTADIQVVVGKHHLSDTKETKEQQQLRISAVILHPNYDSLVLDADLAMVKLLDKARINEKVQPICLPEAQSVDSSQPQAFVTGWTILSEGVHVPENETTRVGAIELGDTVDCEQQYAQNGISVSITENMFCARESKHQFSNICPSDTGGIAIFPVSSTSTAGGQKDSGLVWQLLGLVSWGYEQACKPGLYTVYTRVASFKDWIEKNMK
ncbi:inactive serine protease PAMR1 isoform X2 [Erpetoichthys calabaricus]|uniref:inactive serine protease PAMR1 isoform X2 n=1 Tax=Erpetoichthys calabaricus TaxID=27687 RepID=UPI0022349EA4|nr:inactive serine protease PAMR1 isoform X2 [Erpetoichthys calabaricus]